MLQLEFPPCYPMTSGKRKIAQGDKGQNPAFSNTTITHDGLSFLLFLKTHPWSLPCFSIPHGVILKHMKRILWRWHRAKKAASKSQTKALISIDRTQPQMLQNNLPSSILNVDVTSSRPANPLYQTSMGPYHLLTWIYCLTYPFDKRAWVCIVPNNLTAYCSLAAVL